MPLLLTKTLYDMKLYYSEELRDEVIELSDRHVLWEVNNYDEEEYCLFVNGFITEFEKMFNTHLYLCGRSGRHVCVSNIPENRRRVYNMTRTVERMQRDLIKMFS